jgi:parvulin-like peptidyl-prolyl isomerase
MSSPRPNPPEPLSGVPETPEIELCQGVPWLTVPELNRLLRRQKLAPALARAWLLDQLAARVQLEASEEQHLLEQHVKRHGRPEGVTEHDLLARATAATRLRRWQERRFADEVELRFLERKPELDRVTYSLLRVSERDQAEELYQRIKEGEADFSELSPRYSQGRERETRGLVGPVPLASGHPELVNRLRVGRPGQLWAPFHLVNVWLVVRFEQLLPAGLNDRMRNQMMGELFERWLEERVAELLAGELPMIPDAIQP